MYRARVQAVSGSKVFADGKWLRCIGNKPVSVGERVWTDGRVVFGNYTISQTPLIPIPQGKDTIIPIITKDNCYNFRKGKLIPLFKDGEKIPQTYFVTNNLKRIITPSSIEYCVALNIDKGGNIYALINKGDTVQIRVNNRTVNSIDYGYLSGKVESACSTNPFSTLIVRQAFIENENNWAFSVYADAGDSPDLFDSDYRPNSGPEPYYGAPFYNPAIPYPLYFISSKYFFTNAGCTLIEEQLGHISTEQHGGLFSFVEVFTSDYFNTPGRSSARYPLQDGYYYTSPSGDALMTWSGGYYSTYNRSTHTETRKIFAPNGNMLLEGGFQRNAIIAITKTPYGHLMSVTAPVWNFSLKTIDPWPQSLYIDKYYPDYSHNQLWIGGGLYLLNNGKVTQLLNESINNHFLRPMKNKKNWQNRIETISFDD